MTSGFFLNICCSISGDAIDLLLHQVQDADGVNEGELRLLQVSDRQGERVEVAFDEGQVIDTLQSLFEPLGRILLKSYNHRLHFFEIVSM